MPMSPIASMICSVSPDVEFAAHPKWLGADPTPGWNKALVIVYEVKGRRHIFTTGEGGKVSVYSLLDPDKMMRFPKRISAH